MAKRMKSASESGEKYQRRASAATNDYKTGVQQTNEWAGAALAAIPRTHAGLQQAIADNRIAAGIQTTGDSGWKGPTLAKGVQNYGPAVAQARPKYEQAMQTQLQIQESARQATSTMDRTTLEGRLAVMVAHVTAVAEMNRQRRMGR